MKFVIQMFNYLLSLCVVATDGERRENARFSFSVFSLTLKTENSNCVHSVQLSERGNENTACGASGAPFTSFTIYCLD